MVYNAMKLFMEINPQLFDECSHDYTELQSTADQRQQNRQIKWDRLAELAKNRQHAPSTGKQPPVGSRNAKVATPSRIDDVDPITQDSQQRLDALKLQDEGHSAREQRRPRDQETSQPVRAL